MEHLLEHCLISHIPSYLHVNGRDEVDEFFIDEEVYRRAPKDKDNPFESINLIDVSVNRQGSSSLPMSNSQDVLYNILNEDFEKYDQDISVLVIKELTEHHNYYKEFNSGSSGKFFSMELDHKPVPCNYAHCTFTFKCDGKEVTAGNYKNTLKKDNEARNYFRQELAKMIERREIRINF